MATPPTEEQYKQIMSQSSQPSFITPEIQISVPGFTSANFTHSFQQDVTWATQSLNFESWAKVDISELTPMCGDIKKIKIYKRSQGFQQYELAAETNIENQELLAKDDQYALQNLLGNFTEQSNIDAYWTASYIRVATQPSSAPTTSSNSSIFLGAVAISGSEELFGNSLSSQESASIRFQMKNADWNGDGVSTPGVELFKNGSYQVSFKLASDEVDDGFSESKIKIYLSGSAIDSPTDNDEDLLIDTIIKNGSEIVESTDPTNQSQIAQSMEQKEDGTNLSTSNISDVEISQTPSINSQELVYTFDTVRSGYASLALEVFSGRWHLANVSFKSVKQSGFTPNHTSTEFRIFTDTQQNDIFDFKFELYDNNDELVHTSFTQSLAWQGGNTAITGTTNTIEGKATIGSGIIVEGVTDK